VASSALVERAACVAEGKDPESKGVESNISETPIHQGTDPGFYSRTTVASSDSTPRVVCGLEKKWGEARPGIQDRVQLGPGKFFRPTKGLNALFLRTSARLRPRCKPKPPPLTSSP